MIDDLDRESTKYIRNPWDLLNGYCEHSEHLGDNHGTDGNDNDVDSS